MPTVKQNRTHDMLQLRVSYAKGNSLLLTCSRNGESIKMTPDDLDVAVALGSIVTHITRRMRADPNGAMNFGIMFDRLEIAATAATDYTGFLAEARRVLDVPEGLPKPAGTGTPPATTLAEHKPGRSHSLRLAFPSGETATLSIGGSSCGITSDPAVCAIDNRIMSFALSARPMGYAPEVTAKALAAYAKRCPDLITFVKGLGLPVLQGVSP